MDTGRKRTFQSRSRAGCITCKKRHLRCDENRPLCSNCHIASRQCKYAPPGAPLADQRRQKEGFPGVFLWTVPAATLLDPFDTLPIDMSSRSRELFFHFAQARYDASICGPVPPTITLLAAKFAATRSLRDCITLNTQEPVGLQGVLLLAGLHFRLMTGGAQMFNPAFLFHKGEAIKYINKSLQPSPTSSSLGVMKLIATLSVLESCVGNIASAEAHIDGLLTLIEIQESELAPTGTQVSSDELETAHRMLLLAYHFVGAIKSRLFNSQTERIQNVDVQWNPSFSSLSDMLSALRLMPFYFPSTSIKTNLVDGSTFLAGLHGTTRGISNANIPETSHCVVQPPIQGGRDCSGPSSLYCFGCRGLVAGFLSLMLAHAQSLSQTPPGKEIAFPSSWCGLAIAGNFYLNSVLCIWNAGLPIKRRLFGRLIMMLKEDIQGSAETMLKGGEGRELWFWKAFVGAYILGAASEQAHMCQSQNGGHRDGTIIHRYLFHEHIRQWSKTAIFVLWEDARAALQRVVWPDVPVGDERARRIWTEAVLSDSLR